MSANTQQFAAANARQGGAVLRAVNLALVLVLVLIILPFSGVGVFA
jgi:hypothetical protein